MSQTHYRMEAHRRRIKKQRMTSNLNQILRRSEAHPYELDGGLSPRFVHKVMEGLCPSMNTNGLIMMKSYSAKVATYCRRTANRISISWNRKDILASRNKLNFRNSIIHFSPSPTNIHFHISISYGLKTYPLV